MARRPRKKRKIKERSPVALAMLVFRRGAVFPDRKRESKRKAKKLPEREE